MRNIVLVVLLIAGVALLVFGVSELRGLFVSADEKTAPQNVAVTNTTDKSATVTFTTREASTSLIQYGVASDQMTLFATEQTQTTAHEVTLSFLSPNTTYYFQIQVGDKTYLNNGVPWEFTTQPSAAGSVGVAGSQFDDLDPETFKQKFGTSDSQYDLNSDGIVNSTDYLLYLQKVNNL